MNINNKSPFDCYKSHINRKINDFSEKLLENLSDFNFTKFELTLEICIKTASGWKTIPIRSGIKDVPAIPFEYNSSENKKIERLFQSGLDTLCRVFAGRSNDTGETFLNESLETVMGAMQRTNDEQIRNGCHKISELCQDLFRQCFDQDTPTEKYIESIKVTVFKHERPEINVDLLGTDEDQPDINEDPIVITKTIEEKLITKCKMCPTIYSTTQKILKCKGCNAAYYCSTKCQALDWKNHKVDCLKDDKDIQDDKDIKDDLD